jgi:ArsR family transcriptional regulator
MKELLSPLKAAADESRLAVLWMLESGELCSCEIQAVLGLAPSTVSKHMQLLEEAGLVVSSRRGPWKDYRLNPAPDPFVQGLLAQLRLVGLHHPRAAAVRPCAVAARAQAVCAG